MREVTYQDCVKYVAIQQGVHRNCALTVLKWASKVLQHHVSHGGGIEIAGLFTIQYRIKDIYIYKNDILTFDRLVELVTEQTIYTKIDVESMLNLYFKFLKDSVEYGNKITIKGIGTLEPFEDEDGVIYLEGKISPCLKKPTEADFLILDKKGSILLQQFNRKQLKFAFSLAEDLRVPRWIQQPIKPMVYLDSLAEQGGV